MGKLFVLGDIHGAYRALRQCLERSSFDNENDHLVFLGDVCDGWPETRESIDELMRIKHLTCLLGNHDTMSLPWMKRKEIQSSWVNQGGEATMKSYADGVPGSHIAFIESALPYYVLSERCFVHAGYDPDRPLAFQDIETFTWERSLARRALEAYHTRATGNLTPFAETYVGHTPIPFGKPVLGGGVWLMDTGAGWSGVLSMMNVETKELFQSDAVPSLYPGVNGRGQR
ncbi:metallophosphoesterase [Chryseolinea sp. T2]|uniref:metallophosphoesterase n=1 Tax=Chryseolinea sp. T2 TaxID=3129255 RepID=UPI003077E126